MFRFTNIKTVPVQLSTGIINVPVCNKRTWERVNSSESIDGICGALIAESVPHNMPDKLLLVQGYKNAILQLKENLKLEMPYYPNKENKDAIKYTMYNCFDKLVADYANMSIYEIDEINILEYWLLLRDAFIYNLAQTKEGKQYLNDAYRLTQTDADEEIDI